MGAHLERTLVGTFASGAVKKTFKIQEDTEDMLTVLAALTAKMTLAGIKKAA